MTQLTKIKGNIRVFLYTPYIDLPTTMVKLERHFLADAGYGKLTLINSGAVQ